MTDIVEGPITVLDEAPVLYAEITRLRAENERLRAALWDVHAIANNGPLIWSKRIKATVRAALDPTTQQEE